jgi:hypothetical protein
MINRRKFLTGLGGAMVALPALESVRFLGGRKARAADSDLPVYSVFVRQGNGVQQARGSEPDRFWPRNLGALTTAILADQNSDRALSELADYADDLLLVRGTNQPFGGSGAGHEGGICQCLTAARVTDNGPGSLALGESIDWFLSQRVNPGAVEPLTLMAGAQNAYLPHKLSYSGPQQLRAAANDPFAVYQDLMGLGGAPVEVLEQIALRRRSVNDLVREDMQDLMSKAYLSSSDKQRLDTHFEAIRDLEVGMSCELADSEVMVLQDISGAAADNGNRVVVTRLMMDLIALAFSCDANRVATLQIGSGNDTTRYTIDGQLQNTFHRISHRVDSDGSNGDPIPNADLLHHKIDRLMAQSFKHLLDRLSSYTGPSGERLLDDTMALWTNDLATGGHTRMNIPQVIAGKAGGALKTGQYISAGGVTHNKLLNTLITAAGVRKDDGSPWDDFGDDSLEKGIIAAMLA